MDSGRSGAADRAKFGDCMGEPGLEDVLRVVISELPTSPLFFVSLSFQRHFKRLVLIDFCKYSF